MTTKDLTREEIEYARREIKAHLNVPGVDILCDAALAGLESREREEMEATIVAPHCPVEPPQEARPAEEPRDETGWVIEQAESEPSAPLYYDGLGWSANHLEAIRYARKEDAERQAVGLDGERGHRICEHMWVGVCHGEHDWFTPDFIGYECCRKCGVVKRKDGQNKPCKGVVKVGLREAPTPSPSPGVEELVRRAYEWAAAPSLSDNWQDLAIALASRVTELKERLISQSDEIERAEQKLARERDPSKNSTLAWKLRNRDMEVVAFQEVVDKQLAELSALKAENERMRGAMREILRELDEMPIENTTVNCSVVACQRIARALLNGSK